MSVSPSCFAVLAVVITASCFSGPVLSAEPVIASGGKPLTVDGAREKLHAYRAALEAFRKEYGGTYDLPDVRFYLFGMGQRAKYIYRDGALMDAKDGKVVREWKITSDMILPDEYSVVLATADGRAVQIKEDETGVWITEGGKSEPLDDTAHKVVLPRFEDNSHAPVLRVLHQELLVNVTAAGPVPNFFVYPKPWYRDGAMMALAFQKTGNLHVIQEWIRSLREPFDRNNNGETEADNLGQVLYLVSLVADKEHPLVERVLQEAKRFEASGEQGRYIKGRSDFAEHPVYQTKWMKFGLRALGLPDPYTIPIMADGYSALFWMDYRDSYVPGKDSYNRAAYPYLGWACDHFHGRKGSPISNRDYPLTWEQNASEARYAGLEVLDREFVTRKISAPHTWHAAEVFLYLLDRK